MTDNPDIKPSTKKYRLQCVAAIKKTWPELESVDARKVTKLMCQDWARKLRKEGTKFRLPGAKKAREGISSSRFNNTVIPTRLNTRSLGAKHHGICTKNRYDCL
jgi:hypothetical protein